MTGNVRLMTRAEAEAFAALVKPHLPPGWTIHVEPPGEGYTGWAIGIYHGRDMFYSDEGYSWARADANREEMLVHVGKTIDLLKRREAERNWQPAYQPVLFQEL